MTINPKKMAVIELLGRQTQPIGIRDLLSLLGDGYPERSVRRWLSEFIEKGKVVKIGNKRGTRYYATPFLEVNECKPEYSSTPATDPVAYIQQPIFHRKPVSYHTQWLENYEPNKTSYLSSKMKYDLQRMGSRNKNHDPAGTYARQIYNRLLIDLSYNSARLEGNTYSLLETKQLLLQSKNAEDKLDEEHVMILNHKEAIRFLVDHSSENKIDTQSIFTIHFLLSDGLIDNLYCGNIRAEGVRISGSSYIPLENPNRLKEQLQKIIGKANDIQDPFEKSFFLLVHISYLQAFIDVNKRTARLCCNFPLLYNNLVPLSFNDVIKEDYLLAMLCIYELNDTNALCELYSHSYLRTCQQYEATTESLGFDRVRALYRQQRRKLIREIILNQLVGKPLHQYAEQQASLVIQSSDRNKFLKDLYEDLDHLAPHRLAGLGVTQAELQRWRSKYNKN